MFFNILRNITSATHIVLINTPAGLSSSSTTNSVTMNSTFSCTPAGGTTHSRSQWQVATNSTFTTGLFDSGEVTNLTSYTRSSLTPGTTYYWRVRHKGANGEWSSYTAAQTRATTAVVINTPTGLSSSSTTTGITMNSTFSCTPAGGTTHSRSQWQVATNSTFTTGLFDSGEVTNLTSYRRGSLTPGTTYYWRVRHKGANGLWSSYTAAQTRATTAISIGSIIDGVWLVYADGGSFWRAIRCDANAFSQTIWRPTFINVGASSLTDGLANTNKMSTATGGARAWVNSKGGYLGARDELLELYDNKSLINAYSASPLPNSYVDAQGGYGWSSTEYSATYARYVSFVTRFSTIGLKTVIHIAIPLKRIPK